ncbi:MAG: transaldolase [Armatimonadetes bacterium]|nr:transaldolase [Armatimonadota bacterium]
MADNPLVELQAFGQSVWLDSISRGMIASGELMRYIEEDGLRGVTSNPAIFEKAFGGSAEYDAEIRALARSGKDAPAIYESLTVGDVQRAADVFRPIYDREGGRDGYVSLEVSPRLAYDTEGTIAEAHRLWEALDRPNVFIKVPSTREGLPAIRRLIGEGINVNVTLLFGLQRYGEVAESFIAGLEDRAAKGLPLEKVASVASFFLSRIDVLVDPMLEKMGEEAVRLRGKTAIASAKVAYSIYKAHFCGDRFRKMSVAGGRPQRLLWASTSTKNPDYPDTMYVEPLIGPETVNTVPLETLNAYRDHGHPASTLENDLDESLETLRSIADLGIDLDTVSQQLETEGVEKFIKPYDKSLEGLKARM